MYEEVRSLKVTQARLAATIDRLTITIEGEGKLKFDIKLES